MRPDLTKNPEMKRKFRLAAQILRFWRELCFITFVRTQAIANSRPTSVWPFESQLEQDRVSRSTVRLVSPDKRELNLKVTDATGKVFYDSTITVMKRETEKRNIE